MAANRPFANLDRLSKLATPQPKPFDFKPTQGGERIRIDFADSISLSNRTSQPGLGTTTALAQYYLSDQNTGIIKIKKQLPVEHKSDVVINKSVEIVNQGSIVLPLLEFVPNQGATEVRSFTIDSLLRQGTSISNGTYSSFTNNQNAKSTAAISIAQGTYTSNQITYSVVQTKDAVPIESINQGSVTINKILPNVNQGSVSITQAADTPFIEARQGIRRFNQSVTSDIEPTTPEAIEIRVPYATLFRPKTETPLLVPASIIVVNSKPANAFIDGRNPEIQTLGYLADRFASQLLPSLRHGSEDPQNRGYITKNGNTPHSIIDSLSSVRNSVLLEEDGGTLEALNPSNIQKVGPNNNSETKESTKTAIRVLSGALSGNQLAAAIRAIGKEDSATLEYGELQDGRDAELEDAHYLTVQTIQGVDGFSPNPNIIYGRGLSTTDTDETAGFLNTYVSIDKQKGSTYRKEKAGWLSQRKYNEINNYQDIQNVVKDKELNPTPLDVKERVIRVKSLAGAGTVSFTAFLTSFSDSHTANWTDINHVGQMDTFKVYKGATRQISVGFKVVGGYTGPFTNSPATAGDAVAKLNSLINTSVIGALDGNYVKGPIVELSVVGLVNNIVCAISSIKIDTDVAETGWDADTAVPHVFSVSIDATALATKGGALLSNTATYIG